MKDKKLIKGILPAKRYDNIMALLKVSNTIMSDSLDMANKDVTEIKYFARKYYRAYPDHKAELDKLDGDDLEKLMILDVYELTLQQLITRLLLENRVLSFYYDKYFDGTKEMVADYKNKSGIFEVKQTSEIKRELTEKFNKEMLICVKEVKAAAGNFVALTDLLKSKYQETFLKYK